MTDEVGTPDGKTGRLERGLEVLAFWITQATSEYRVDVDAGQVRLDVYLAQQRSDLTRAQLQKLIGEGYVRLNGSLQPGLRRR